MIGNKPSIYNAQSVYNQGGGGTFDVDLGGGEKQTLTFPPYLVPVEYIDTTDYTEDALNIIGAAQFPTDNNYLLKCVFQQGATTSNTETIFGFSACYNWTSNYDSSFGCRKSDSNFLVELSSGSNAHSFSGINETKKIIASFNAASKLFKVEYSDESGYFDYNDTRALPSKNFGQWSIFNNWRVQASSTFHGKFFYSYVRKGGEIIALWIPARCNDDNVKQPYVVECVSGAVGVNCSENKSTMGIYFGPDIDLSDVSSYFV